MSTFERFDLPPTYAFRKPYRHNQSSTQLMMTLTNKQSVD